MDKMILYWTLAALIPATVTFIWLRRPSGAVAQHTILEAKIASERTAEAKAVRLIQDLYNTLPEIVLLPDHKDFSAAANLYWAAQESEALPYCIVRPRNTEELSSVVKLFKHEYDTRRHEGDVANGVFAIRSGGHAVPSGAASLRDGVVLDLSNFAEVVPSTDRNTVRIGTGARWGQVYEKLAERGLCVVGGRNDHTGVGGLTLGGGFSYYSPRFGMVCNNIQSYEIVLASGKMVQASETEHGDLWRALKGGSNNFGIVTSFTARTFPDSEMWGGYLYQPYFEHERVLSAFYDSLQEGESGTIYDPCAGALLTCFAYFHPIRLKLCLTHMTYTGDVSQLPTKQWPQTHAQSPWPRLWRYWSTVSKRTLRSTTGEMTAFAPSGLRQGTATTTIVNDLATLAAAHAAWHDAIAGLKERNVKGASWNLVFQPMLPTWARKGDPNHLGLAKGTSAPLVNISFSINWGRREDDEYMDAAIRKAIESIEAFAQEKGTGHPYKYLNYAGGWQKVFEGYGEENVRFLKQVSGEYDPEGLFQRGCVGGFKLGV